jgi:uncharacterized protein (UPF0333 family)
MEPKVKPDFTKMVLYFIALLIFGIGCFGAMRLFNPGLTSPGSLPSLAIGMAILMVLALALVAALFSGFELTDRTQALALPEGSIRAIISLSLIVLFAFITVFLYQGVTDKGDMLRYDHATEAQRDQFLSSHPGAVDIQALVVVDKNGAMVTDGGNPAKPLYNITYRSARSTAGDDFAKQLLTLLGTLMASVTSYYLGAKSATSAATAATNAATSAMRAIADPGGLPPTIDEVKGEATAGATSVTLNVTGANLNTMTRARLIRGTTEIVATTMQSSPTTAVCSFTLTEPLASSHEYDLILDDGSPTAAPKTSVTKSKALVGPT